MRKQSRPFNHTFRRRTPPGAPPGALVADPHALPTTMRLFAYGPDRVEERTLRRVAEVEPFLERFPVTWLDVAGLADTALIAEIGKRFRLHELALEDVVNVHQRAKVERYGGFEFVVVRAVEWREGVETGQISFFLGKRFVVTFQERPGDEWEPVRERIRGGHPAMRNSGVGYLVYSLLDAVVDGYFPVLEALGERLEALEDEVLAAPKATTVAHAHQIRRDLLLLRRAIWPQREVFQALSREANPLIGDETRFFFRDCYDHVIQIIDLVENYREVITGLQDLYLSSVNNRLNEIMKVLTMIATLFIPLSFITGLYGMNFHVDVSPFNMPELRWYWGYPFALGLMATVAVAFLAFFRHKGWIGKGEGEERKVR